MDDLNHLADGDDTQGQRHNGFGKFSVEVDSQHNHQQGQNADRPLFQPGSSKASKSRYIVVIRVRVQHGLLDSLSSSKIFKSIPE